MALPTPAWTRDLVTRRRALHSRIDVIAPARPAAAARHRLELYTITHRFDTGTLSAAELDLELAVLEEETGLTARAA